MLWCAAVVAAEPNVIDLPDPTAGWSASEHPSGLRVWIKDLPGSPVVRVSASVLVGSMQDPPGLEGLAHLTEHVLLTSSPTRTEAEIRRDVSDRGGTSNGYTHVGHSSYFVEVPAPDLEFALEWIHARLFAHDGFPAEVVDAERRAVLLEDDLGPVPALLDRVPWLRPSFQWFPSRWERDFGLPAAVAGRAAGWTSLQRIDPSDVTAFWRRWYGPQNVVLYVVGDVDLASVSSAVDATFAGLTPRGDTATSHLEGVTRPGVERRYGSTLQRTSNVRVEWRLANATERDYVLALLVRNVLRRALHERLRVEQKVAYAVDVDLHTTFGNLSLEVDARVAPAAADAALQDVLREVERLRAGRTPAEVWAAERAAALASLRRSSLTPSSIFNNWLGDGSMWWRHLFAQFPPIVAIAERTDAPTLGRWIDERLLPGGRTEVIERAQPVTIAVLAGMVTAVAVALGWGGSRRRASTVDLTRLRYVRKVQYGPVLLAAEVFVIWALVGALVPPVWAMILWFVHLGERVDATWVHGLVLLPVPAALVLLLTQLALSLPSKLLLFEHELRVKSFGARSVGIPWAEVGEVARLRLVDLAGPRWIGCVPLTFGRGVYLRLGPRRALFVSTRDDAELVRMVERLRNDG